MRGGGVSSNVLALMELILILALVFGFGFWQLRALKKDTPPKETPREDGRDEDG